MSPAAVQVTVGKSKKLLKLGPDTCLNKWIWDYSIPRSWNYGAQSCRYVEPGKAPDYKQICKEKNPPKIDQEYQLQSTKLC